MPMTDNHANFAHPHEARIRKRLRGLSWFMDNSIRLPTGHRIGVDGLIGLIPGIGDLFGAAVSGYFVVSAARLGLPKAVMGRMTLNILVETIIGAIPLVGDLFDLGWKANARNFKLVERYLESPQRTRRSSNAIVAGSFAVAVALFVLTAFVVVGLVVLAWRTLFG